MVKAVFLSSSDLAGLTEELRRLPVVLYRHGSEDIVDVSPGGGADKWTGLKALSTEQVPVDERLLAERIRMLGDQLA